MPLFLLALLSRAGRSRRLVRILVRPPSATAAGLLQATSLPFIVAATQIGVVTGRWTPSTRAALVCAGLLSVLLFPPAALSLLRGARPAPEEAADVRPGPHPVPGRFM